MHVKYRYKLNRKKRFVKTVKTKNKLNCINLQFAIRILKNRLFQTCIIIYRKCISIFSKIGLVYQPKPCTQIYLQIFLICINLQLAIRIFLKIGLLDMHSPLTDIQANFELNGLVRHRNTAKRNYFHRRQTDRQTAQRADGRTDGGTDGRTDVAYDNNR